MSKVGRILCYILLVLGFVASAVAIGLCIWSSKSNEPENPGAEDIGDDPENPGAEDPGDDPENPGAEDPGDEPGVSAIVNAISLDTDYWLFSSKDETYTLIATVDADEGVTYSVLWTSSNEDVATVSAVSSDDTLSAVITAAGEGTSTITASVGTLSATCTVTVTYGVEQSDDISIKIDDLVDENNLVEGKQTLTSSETLYSEDGTKISTTISSSSSSSSSMTYVTSEIDPYRYALNLGGKGTIDNRNIKLVLTGEATVTVYAKSSSNDAASDPRTLVFYGTSDTSDSWDQIDSDTVIADTYSKIVFEAPEEGTYYLASLNSGIDIYEIVITYIIQCAHEYTDGWQVTSIPTTSAKGTAQKICTICGHVETTQLPKLSAINYTITDSETDGYSTYSYLYGVETITFSAPSLPEDGYEEIDGEITYTVTFVTNQTTISNVLKSVFSNSTVEPPVLPSVSGQYLYGWYTDSDLTKEYDFTTTVTADFTLYAKWGELNTTITYAAGAYESLAVEWTDTNTSGVQVYYKIAGASSYTQMTDTTLIQKTDTNTLRVDILGLLGGSTYEVALITSGADRLYAGSLYVTGYDRSGYAHYEYDATTDSYGTYAAGVGAYENDGSLKDGALVIYVTEENKNDVTKDVYKYDKSTDTYAYEDISAYLTLSSDSQETYGKASVTGIGEILNNRRYSGTDRRDVGIAKLCSVYGAVAVRIVGEVTATLNADGLTYDIIGLTDYDATSNGGSIGDNGSMARMVNAQNLTIEGVGEGACVNGWGFHFISSTTYADAGKTGVGFEVRNITFKNYCEDAVGMEGEQASKSTSSDLSASVERCWVHNNTFYPGYCENPAESDKKEGDGSCDFKRGQYFTLSYNYFEDCHKTNLIGSASTSLQFNITMHHNYWYNCGSRIPLVRNANVHFYNNYVYGDPTGTLSYVHSARANSYIYAEYNYYDGCKEVSNTSSEGGGAIKSYNNMYYACYKGDESTQVTSREAGVPNNCKFSARGIDYSHFDTDPTLFYYDEVNERSDCYLTDAVTARREAITGAGAFSRDKALTDTSMAQYADYVTNAIETGDSGLVLDTDQLKSVTSAGVYYNIYFNGKWSSSGVKGKQQVATFKLASETDVVIKTNGTSENNMGELVSSDGTVYGSKFASISVTLPAGTYFVASGNKDKEVTITYMSFVSGLDDDAKIKNVEDLISAIPSNIALDEATKSAIEMARSAYNSLSFSLQASVSNYSALTDAENKYSELQIENVIALIKDIGYDVYQTNGNITADSLSKITAAREAYDALTALQQASVSNADELTAAEKAYANIAESALLEIIGKLPDVSTLTSQTDLEDALASYYVALEQYNALDADQQADVESQADGKGYNYIVDGISSIEQALKIYEFQDMLDEVETENISGMTASELGTIINAYNELTEDQKSSITGDYKTKYDAIAQQYEEVKASETVYIFGFNATGTDSSVVIASESSDVTMSNYNSDSKATFEYNGITYNPVKIESKTDITISVDSGSSLKVTLCISESNCKIMINGETYTSDSNCIVEITLDASDNSGTIAIAKASGNSCDLCYVIVSYE